METKLTYEGSLDKEKNIPVLTNPWHDASVKMLSRILHLRGIKIEELPNYIGDLSKEAAESYFSGRKAMPLNVFMCILFCLRMKVSVEPMEINFFNFMPQLEPEPEKEDGDSK